jgi:hypothetical protein
MVLDEGAGAFVVGAKEVIRIFAGDRRVRAEDRVSGFVVYAKGESETILGRAAKLGEHRAGQNEDQQAQSAQEYPPRSRRTATHFELPSSAQGPPSTSRSPMRSTSPVSLGLWIASRSTMPGELTDRYRAVRGLTEQLQARGWAGTALPGAPVPGFTTTLLLPAPQPMD